MYEEEIKKANTPEALLQVIRSMLEFVGDLFYGRVTPETFQQRALDIRAKNPSFDLPPVPSSLMPVDMQNWCITASKCFHKPSGGQALGGPGKEEAGGPTEAPSPCQRLAGESYEWACKKRPELLAKGRYSNDLYQYVKENWQGYSDPGPACPPKETWARYVREYERLTTGSKNTPRQGRLGRSIVPENEA